MTIATVAEVVKQERLAGSTSQISALLRASNVPPPKGFRMWSAIAVRASVGEDASGFRADGHHGGGK